MSQHHLAADVRRENDLFIAKWFAHEIVSQGRSIEEAIANLREAVELYLEPPAAAAIPEAALEEIGAILRRYSITSDALMKELEAQRAGAIQSNGEIQAPANFRESLSPIGQVLYDISLGTPDDPDRLLTTEEIHEEIARRRGYARTWMHDAE
jgi:predicted RNase H-like HicB family nuclease